MNKISTRILVSVLTLVFISMNSKSQSNLCFNSSNLIPNAVGNQPKSMSNADFNGDGKLDIVVANFGSNNISMLLNTGGGFFASAINYNVGALPFIIKTSDFNEDGKQDVIVTNYNSNNISILLGNGNGTLQPQINYPVGSNPFDLVCADFNGDNHIDIAVTNEMSNNTSILIGSGLGTFSISTTVLTGSQPRSIVASDFNGDGKKDLAIVNLGANNVSVYLGNGLGGFSSALNYSVGTQSSSMVCADFNGDGNPDLGVPNFGIDNKIHILMNNGSGMFAPASLYNAGGSGAWSISANDFNNDGVIDVLINNPQRISILYGTGSGSFLPPVYYPGRFGASYHNVADFDNNGTKDIALSDAYFNNVEIYTNNGASDFSIPNTCEVNDMAPVSFTSGDFNSDGNPDFVVGDIHNGSDSIAMIASIGQTAYLPSIKYNGGGISYKSVDFISGDFNNDNKIDVAFTGGINPINSLTIKLGDGIGSFMTTNTYTVLNADRAITKGDFNNDGKLDIAVATDASGNAGSVTVFLGNGNGTFTSQTYSLNVGTTFDMISADLNNDGTTDIAVGVASGSTIKGIYKLISNGLGGFNGSFFTTSIYPNKITSGDFNSDGKIDLAAVSTSTSLATISIFLGLGSGSFGTPTTFSTGGIITNGNYISIVCTDFNNDGKLDLVNSNWDSESISFHLGIGNGSFAAPIMLYSISGPSKIIPLDLNKDGLNDLAVLGSWRNVVLLLNNTPYLGLVGGVSCVGSTAILQATKGASSYIWSPNLSSSDTMAITTSGIYSVTINFGNNGCAVNSSSISVNFHPIPSVVATVSQSIICSAGSNTLTASGAINYLWSNSQITASVVVSPTITTTYSVTGYDINNCSNTQTVSVVVDPTCSDVWPGDANSDGVADNLDILELGLHYTQNGPTRAIISNTWQSYFSNNWIGTISNGKNLNHSDCNGDGTIDNNDTLAIYNNYGFSHAFKSAQTNTVNPQLSIIPDQASVLKGTWGTASIYLGDATTSINNINGVAFTVDFDNTLIEPSNIWIEYLPSFIDASQNLHFRKLDFPNGKIYTATTHTVSSNANGYGKIATLHYQIKSSLTSAQILNLGISQAYRSDVSGLITQLTTGTGSLTATIDVGLQELLNDNNIFISPNPTNGILSINSKTELQKIEMVSITGSILISETTTSNNHTLNIENYSNGIYFVNIYQNNRVVRREKVIVNK